MRETTLQLWNEEKDATKWYPYPMTGKAPPETTHPPLSLGIRKITDYFQQKIYLGLGFGQIPFLQGQVSTGTQTVWLGLHDLGTL